VTPNMCGSKMSEISKMLLMLLKSSCDPGFECLHGFSKLKGYCTDPSKSCTAVMWRVLPQGDQMTRSSRLTPSYCGAGGSSATHKDAT
jgi:hypothetical protein